ncbi:MAG TPA: SurA N-terminal domain-containing protein [Pyrinomonadaceae bacterium]|nr:SurA N-terminal domain-containing protein [Pyrinomonadaceae bacterium]
MLKQLGRLERTRNIVILGFAILMAVSLIVFYAPGRSAGSIDPSRNTEVVAKVGSNSISVADLARVRQNYAQFGAQMMAQFGNRAVLEGLINKFVILEEAERLGLSASDAEVAEKIREDYKDATGKFDIEKYKKSILDRYGDIEKFENDTRAAISQEKLRAFLSASVNVSDEQIEEEYRRRNTSFDVSYISLTADKLAAKIQPSDEEMRSYFESHKTEYRFLEPQKKVRYIFINTEKAGSKLQISDEDLKAEYDGLAPQYKEAGIKIQQILLKVARKDLDPEVEKKGRELIAKLRGSDGKATDEAFAEAARGHSEDPATARNNGYLLKPFKKNPNKAHGLYDRVADMPPGEVSDIPIRYENNYYILRRGDSVPKTFAEAKPELLVSLRNRRGYGVAFQLAQKVANRLKEVKDPQKVAQEYAAEANMSPAEMVRETGYIKPGDDVPNVGVNQQFEGAIEALNNPNDVGEATGIKDGFGVPMLVDKKEPRIPEFDEVKTKVAEAIKQQRAKEQLEQKAKDLAAALTGPGDLKAAGEREGFDSGLEEGYRRESTLGKAGSSEVLDDAIYNLKEGEVTRTPIRVDDKWVILGLVKRDNANMATFGAERDRIKDTMLRDRQAQVFEDFISRAEERMRREGKITIYEKVLAQLEAAEPAAQPLPGGLNFPNFPVK